MLLSGSIGWNATHGLNELAIAELTSALAPSNGSGCSVTFVCTATATHTEVLPVQRLPTALWPAAANPAVLDRANVVTDWSFEDNAGSGWSVYALAASTLAYERIFADTLARSGWYAASVRGTSHGEGAFGGGLVQSISFSHPSGEPTLLIISGCSRVLAAPSPFTVATAADYSMYVDASLTDGTNIWGTVAPFSLANAIGGYDCVSTTLSSVTGI
eukprot:7377801-Prymnesium_polylepis.2